MSCSDYCLPAGSLRHWIRIERATEAQDALGQTTRTWSTLASVPASYRALGGQEGLRTDGQQVIAKVATEFMIRHRSDVTPKMRVVFNGRYLNIGAAYDPDGMRVKMILVCEEDAD